MANAIDYARLMADDSLTKTLFIRISEDDDDALGALAKRMPLKVAAIARIALRIGLAEIEKDPARIFTAPTTKKKR